MLSIVATDGIHFRYQSEMSINSLQKLVYYAKFYGKITSFSKLSLIFEQDVTGDLTTLTATAVAPSLLSVTAKDSFPLLFAAIPVMTMLVFSFFLVGWYG